MSLKLKRLKLSMLVSCIACDVRYIIPATLFFFVFRTRRYSKWKFEADSRSVMDSNPAFSDYQYGYNAYHCEGVT